MLLNGPPYSSNLSIIEFHFIQNKRNDDELICVRFDSFVQMEMMSSRGFILFFYLIQFFLSYFILFIFITIYLNLHHPYHSVQFRFVEDENEIDSIIPVILFSIPSSYYHSIIIYSYFILIFLLHLYSYQYSISVYHTYQQHIYN